MFKVVTISDTHEREISNIPNGDILIHSGDWSSIGSFKDTDKFLNWISKLTPKFKKIICVPGNHDRWVEANQTLAMEMFKYHGIELLIDREIFVDSFIIYGTPWTPIFRQWAFMADDAKRKLVADAIPRDTNILISHGPPHGILDTLAENGSSPGTHVGCWHLLQAIQELKPKLHVFGHIHEGSGVEMYGKTLCVNASSLDEYYKPVNGFKVIYL